MTITDPKIEKLPIDIYCEGVLMFKNCASLISVEGIHIDVKAYNSHGEDISNTLHGPTQFEELMKLPNVAYLGIYYAKDDGSGMRGLKFENCALPSEIYTTAYIKELSIEQYIEDEIDEIILIPENLEAVNKHFPQIAEKHRGRIIGSKFGF